MWPGSLGNAPQTTDGNNDKNHKKESPQMGLDCKKSSFSAVKESL